MGKLARIASASCDFTAPKRAQGSACWRLVSMQVWAASAVVRDSEQPTLRQSAVASLPLYEYSVPLNFARA
jgi:hypothetical protein